MRQLWPSLCAEFFRDDWGWRMARAGRRVLNSVDVTLMVDAGDAVLPCASLRQSRLR
jgi:hypothetical protein